MGRRNLAVPVKLWALACTIIGISLTTDTLLTCVLTVAGFIYLGVQRNWRFLRSMAAFYAALGILLYLIRFHDFHPAVFSEFYVLMFWNLTPVFLVSWDLITTPPGGAGSLFIPYPHAESCHSGPAGHVPFFSDYEVGIAECLAFHAQPGIDHADPACGASGGIL